MVHCCLGLLYGQLGPLMLRGCGLSLAERLLDTDRKAHRRGDNHVAD